MRFLSFSARLLLISALISGSLGQPASTARTVPVHPSVFDSVALIEALRGVHQVILPSAAIFRSWRLFGGDRAVAPADHSGFGIQMAQRYRMSAAALDRQKAFVVSASVRGALRQGFQQETVHMDDASWDVIVHPAVLKRIQAQHITVEEFVQNAVKIRGPKYERALIQGLSGKRLIIDGLDKSPNLYGNCLGDGYMYINLHAPIEMDIVGVSHEWMHEAGIFSGSARDEARLAIQDRTVMAELGIELQAVKDALDRKILVRQSSLFLNEETDPSLYVGNADELYRSLSPFLRQLGWEEVAIHSFFENLRLVLQSRVQGSPIMTGIGSQAWSILIDVGQQKDFRKYDALGRLQERLARTTVHLNNRETPDYIIRNEKEMALELLIGLDQQRRMASFLAMHTKDVEARVAGSTLLSGLLPASTARDILRTNPERFVDISKREGGETMLAVHILTSLPPDVRRREAANILSKIDRMEMQAYSDPDGSWFAFYDTVVQSFDERVGLLHNANAFRGLYEVQFRESLRLFMVAEEMGIDPENAAYGLMNDEDFSELLAFLTGDNDRELAAFQNSLIDLFNYNPGPEMLEQVIHFFRQYPGPKAQPLTPGESNTLIWLVRHIPKKDGLTRDRRRQVHRYLLTMWEEAQRGELRTRQFMGDAMAFIDTQNMPPESVTDSLNFMLQFTNLAAPMRRAAAEALDAHLREWQKTAPSHKKKAFLTGAHFRAMTDLLNTILLDHFISDAVSLTPEEGQQFRAHVAAHRAAWDRGNFLRQLASYHSFQNSDGKRYTEALVRQLLASKVEGDRFKAIPRDTWDAKTAQWLGRDFLKVWQAGYRREVPLTGHERMTAAQFQGIYRDILEHLEISTEESNASPHALVQAWIESLENKDIPDDERRALSQTIESILYALQAGEPIAADQIRAWKTQLIPEGQTPHWFQTRRPWREVLVNLDQILRIQTFDWSQVVGMTFEITDDPVDFALSATEPYQTCQRLYEPTGQNDDGRPINRIRQGQFLLARLVARLKSGGTTVLARAHLEIAESLSPEQFARQQGHVVRNPVEKLLAEIYGGVDRGNGSQADASALKVLLVERIYQQGLLPIDLFDDELLNWASHGLAGQPLVDDVSFAGQRGHSWVTYVRFLPSDGPIYRDTFREGMINTINLRPFAVEPPAAPSDPTHTRNPALHAA